MEESFQRRHCTDIFQSSSVLFLSRNSGKFCQNDVYAGGKEREFDGFQRPDHCRCMITRATIR